MAGNRRASTAIELQTGQESDKYRRIKKISFLLLKSSGKGAEERLVPYDNDAFAVFIWLVFFLELLKNLYFVIMPLSVQTRILYGDMIISDKADQRLYNLIMVVVYFFACFVYLSSYFFGEQRRDFGRLADFLLVRSLDEFVNRFAVSKEFAASFIRQLGHRVRLATSLVYGYSIMTYSYYAFDIYFSLKLQFGYRQILCYTVPSICVGMTALLFIYRLLFQCFIFFTLHTKLINAKLAWLCKQLNGFDQKTSRQKIADHLKKLNSVLDDFSISRRYFGSAMASFFPSFFSTFFFFPSMVLISGRLFTNQLTGFYLVNLWVILIPVGLNEQMKREMNIYLSSVQRFVERSKAVKSKLKILKIFDLVQRENQLIYTLMGGVFDLDKELVFRILAETYAITFLVYTFMQTYGT